MMEGMTWLTDIAKHAGLPVAIMVFYIWRDWKREQGMAEVINNLTQRLMVITENSTDAVAKNAIQLENLTAALSKLTDRIESIKA